MQVSFQLPEAVTNITNFIKPVKSNPNDNYIVTDFKPPVKNSDGSVLCSHKSDPTKYILSAVQYYNQHYTIPRIVGITKSPTTTGYLGLTTKANWVEIGMSGTLKQISINYWGDTSVYSYYIAKRIRLSVDGSSDYIEGTRSDAAGRSTYVFKSVLDLNIYHNLRIYLYDTTHAAAGEANFIINDVKLVLE